MSLYTFRDSILRAAPPWLQRAWASRLLYAMGIQFDALIDATVLALKLRFPQYALSDAIPQIGRERGIRRGFDEGATGYAARLVRWVDDRRIKGSPFALMSQLIGYLTGYTTNVRIVNAGGAWFGVNSNGVKWSYLGSWDWDGQTDLWSRYWVIIDVPYDSNLAPLWTIDTTWGDGTYWGDDPNLGWGLNITLDQVASLQQIVKEWNAPHERAVNIIINFYPVAFWPVSAVGVPDGDWGNWYKLDGSDNAVLSRLNSARYLDGMVSVVTQDNTPPADPGEGGI